MAQGQRPEQSPDKPLDGQNKPKETSANSCPEPKLPIAYSEEQATKLRQIAAEERFDCFVNGDNNLPPLKVHYSAHLHTKTIRVEERNSEGSGIIVRDIDPKGSVTETLYDRLGFRSTNFIDNQRNYVSNEYDPKGRLTATQTRDRNGHLIRHEAIDLETGNKTFSHFDSNNLLVSEVVTNAKNEKLLQREYEKGNVLKREVHYEKGKPISIEYKTGVTEKHVLPQLP